MMAPEQTPTAARARAIATALEEVAEDYKARETAHLGFPIADHLIRALARQDLKIVPSVEDELDVEEQKNEYAGEIVGQIRDRIEDLDDKPFAYASEGSDQTFVSRRRAIEIFDEIWPMEE